MYEGPPPIVTPIVSLVPAAPDTTAPAPGPPHSAGLDNPPPPAPVMLPDTAGGVGGGVGGNDIPNAAPKVYF